MNSKKKILLINGAQFGHSSGHYFYCKHLSENFDINYICFDRGLKKISFTSVKVYYVSFSGSSFTRIFRFLKECIRLSYIFKPQILFVTYFSSCFILALLCISQVSVLDIRTGSLKKNKTARFIDNLFVHFQSLFYNRITILSEGLRLKLYISPVKSQIVPLGSEVFFRGSHVFNILDLLYVGSLDGRCITKTINGLSLFLEKNNSNLVNISYTIIGFGSDIEIQKLKDCVLENNLSDIVKYEGRKTHEELAYYFEKSNIGIVFVPQTPWYDCQPVTKLYEYMLSGMPVIATNTIENRLLVIEKNGVLINDSAEDFCDGLQRIYDRRGSYNSEDIRYSMESYTWGKIVKNNLKPFLFSLVEKST